MEISGKVWKIMEVVSGEGKNGPWKKMEFIVELAGPYPRKVCFTLWGDKITQNPVTVGQEVTVSFDLESTEWGNKWYTQAKAWKIAQKLTEKGPDREVPLPGEEDVPNDLPGGNLGSFKLPDEKDIDDLPF